MSPPTFVSRVSAKPYFVYVLWSKRGHRFYIGISENPQQRLRQHNSNPRGWTARYQPWQLVSVEPYENYRSARQRELKLKAHKGGVGFFHDTGLDPDLFPRGS